MEMCERTGLVKYLFDIKENIDNKYRSFIIGELFDQCMGNVNKTFSLIRPVVIMIGQEQLSSASNSYGWPITWDFAPKKGFILRIDCGNFILQFINGHLPLNCINSLVDRNFNWNILDCDYNLMYYELNQATRIYIIESETTDFRCKLFYKFLYKKYMTKVFYAQILMEHKKKPNRALKSEIITVKAGSLEDIITLIIGEDWAQVFYKSEVERLKNYVYVLFVSLSY